MTAVSRSSRIDQSDANEPLSMKRKIRICSVSPPNVRNTIQLSSAAMNSSPVAEMIAARSPIRRWPKPQTTVPRSGANRMAASMPA